MDELILTCTCGHQKRISVYSVGMVETCEGCGRRIQSSNENTSAPPVEQPAPTGAAPVRETHRPPNVCPECGNAFRGDWDRVETQRGIVCHHCSVLATETAPDLRHLSGPDALDLEKAPNLESPPKTISIGAWTVDPESVSFKRWVLAAGLFLIAVTVVLALTDDYAIPESGGGSSVETKEVPGYVSNLYAAWQLLAFYVCAFCAFYLVLQRELRLPHETFGRNALHIGRPMLAVTLILAIAAGFLLALTPIPLVGRVIPAIIVSFIGGILIIKALSKYLDFGLKDYFLWFLFFSLIEILAQAATIAVWAAIYSAIL